jgi:hypothetical protein
MSIVAPRTEVRLAFRRPFEALQNENEGLGAKIHIER